VRTKPFQISRRSLIKSASAGLIGFAAQPAAAESLEIGPSKIEVSFQSEGWELPRAALLDWVSQCGRAVAAYYGALPVPSAQLQLSCVDGEHGVMHGKTFGYRGARTTLGIGQHATVAELNEDWILVHEMVHWGFPSVEDEHHWIEEGTATYVEPIARILIHNLTPERVWGDLVRDMPKGVPEPGSRGLDRTDSWASTYWGGALFCLLADVQIRKQTGNAKGLQNALRSIVKSGGVITAEWPLRRAFAIGDREIGGSVLADLHEQMGHNRKEVDLPAMWTQLGVIQNSGGIAFNNRAPLASVRRAIMPEGRATD
jgi:hypothetical protein